MRIFLDANVLFSAADPGSVTRKLFNAACRYGELRTNPHAWEEARINLARKRPGSNKGLESLRKRLAISHAYERPQKVNLPQMDVPILAGAMGAKSDYLWTSDRKHFGRWYGKKLQGVQIVSSVMLADILIKAGWKP